MGHCGDFTIIELGGALGGRMLLWFDRSGRLVGQRNSTHFPAYCGAEAMTAYQGEVPDCSEAVHDEDDLLVRTKRSN